MQSKSSLHKLPKSGSKSRLRFQFGLAVFFVFLVAYKVAEYRRNDLGLGATSALQSLIDRRYADLARFATPEEQNLNLIQSLKAADELVFSPGLSGSKRLDGFETSATNRYGVAFAKYQLRNGMTLDVGFNVEPSSDGQKTVILEKVLRYGWLANYMSQPGYQQGKMDLIVATAIGLRRDRQRLESAGISEIMDQSDLKVMSLESYQNKIETLIAASNLTQKVDDMSSTLPRQ